MKLALYKYAIIIIIINHDLFCFVCLSYAHIQFCHIRW